MHDDTLSICEPNVTCDFPQVDVFIVKCLCSHYVDKYISYSCCALVPEAELE